MMRRIAVWNGWIALLLLAPPVAMGAGDSRIDINRKDPVIGRREFDPARPPAEMPPLKANEAAQCSSDYSCAANSNLSVTIRPGRSGKPVTAEVVITRVQVSVGMSVTLWLPEHAAKKLVDHEEGHQKINEKVYATAEAVAREEAARVLGQRVTATGESDDEATEAARKKVNELLKTVNDNYMQRVAAYASTVNDSYDLLTGHGTKMKPDEAQAIEQAFAKHPATAPSTTKISSSRP